MDKMYQVTWETKDGEQGSCLCESMADMMRIFGQMSRHSYRRVTAAITDGSDEIVKERGQSHDTAFGGELPCR